jgi:cytidylate kinase
VPNDAPAIEHLAEHAAITCELRGGDSLMRIDGIDPELFLREDRVNDNVSLVSSVPRVRAILVDHLRRYAETNNLVMEGRDIGSVVFPNAALKIFLDADVQERARRRAMEVNGDCDVISRQIRERDERDRTRAEAPLTQAPDAVYVDSTGLSIEEVEETILRLVRARISNGKEFR